MNFLKLVRRKIKKNKRINKTFIMVLIMILVISFCAIYRFKLVDKLCNLKGNIIIENNKNIQQTIANENSSNLNIQKEYKVNLEQFNIKNNGSHPIETSSGINKALQYAKTEGYTKVTMPSGEYCISETDPIIMLDNIVLDLNGSVFRINTNGLQKYTIIDFTGCKNAKLINGTLLGDRYTHDYDTVQGSHEWGCAVVFNDSEECELNNVTVKSFPGYGISSSLGKNISNLIIGVTKQNLEVGSISDKGVLNKTTGTIRTIKALDISEVGSEFELGYDKGYMGYPYMNVKTYNAYFYDKNMKFITAAKMCRQYKKITIPQGAAFVHFVFNQQYIPEKGDTDFESTTVFLTNYKSPYKIKISNCLIEDNRSLGMGLCGGRDFTIENNTFKKNGGGAPGYAVDLEDGWEYMDKYLFKGNKFINNSNDVVVCAGDDITFQDNEFTSTVYMWGRATNYKFINNNFKDIQQNINYEYSSDITCTGNTYTNSRIVIYTQNKEHKVTFENEKLINTSINTMSDDVVLKNSVIESDSNTPVRLAGSYKNCSISSKEGAYISTKIYDCKMENTNLFSQGDTVFENCSFVNSSTNTNDQTKTIKVKKCKFKDSDFTVNTWGAAAVIDVQNSDITMSSGTSPFINISAGKMSSLIFKTNKVANQIEKPVFNMYDTGYSLADGKAALEDNNFTQTAYPYIFDGVSISDGTFKLINSNNKIQGADIINPQYINNKDFYINK